MSTYNHEFTFPFCKKFAVAFFAVVMAAVPRIVGSEIIWSGDFATGDFTQWHTRSNVNEVTFHLIPVYGRPIQYGKQNPIHIGDGSLLSLVSQDGRTIGGINYPRGPTRGGPFAAKFTVKNSANGSEPDDCDVIGCRARRTELTAQHMLMDVYNGMPYLGERWASVSMYIPSDWSNSGSGWGPLLFNIKERNEPHGGDAAFAIGLKEGTWNLSHKWYPGSVSVAEMPWQYQMFYSGNEGGSPYPRSDNWPDGMRDFPDVAVSHAALKSVNKGGWTDWVLHMTWDGRGTTESGPNGELGENVAGTGFLSVWKREDDGPWVKVLHIVPKWTTRGGMTFNHGIGFITPGGYGIKQGMYMAKDQVWNSASDRVVYIANTKVGDENTTFSDMTHDGSSPDSSPGTREPAMPAPPEILPVE